MSIVHFGSYWMGENDIVALMARDLQKAAPQARLVDTELYTGRPSVWVEREGQVNWIKDAKVERLLQSCNPEVIVVNSGGMSLRPETAARLREKGVTLVGISLSDPDVFAAQGSRYAPLYDLFYTNARRSLADYEAIGVKARLLPFAASADFHRPLPEVSRRYDVVIVGHPRADRLEVVRELDRHFKVGVYGKGWKHLGIFPRGRQVNGEAHVRALNSGKVYLSFSATVAGYINVKVGLFEAVACGTPVFTEIFDEMRDYFAYGEEVVGYDGLADLVAKLKVYLGEPDRLETVAQNARARLLREHTWEARWRSVLDDIAAIRTGL